MVGEGRLTTEDCQRELPLSPGASCSFYEGLTMGPQVVVSGGSSDGHNAFIVQCLQKSQKFWENNSTEPWDSSGGEDGLGHRGLFLEWKMCCLREKESCAPAQVGHSEPCPTRPAVHLHPALASFLQETLPAGGKSTQARPGFP